MDPVNPAKEWQDTWSRMEDASAIGAARRLATSVAEDQGFDEARIGQVAVAVSEAASNLVKHAREGTMLVRPHPTCAGSMEVISVDSGPGMADTVGPIRDGYSTAGTLGIGLGAITRLSDSYDIYSRPGAGTVLSMHFTARNAPRPADGTCGLFRPVSEEIASGDALAFADIGRVTVAFVCDGLGHGIMAAEASQAAVRVFREHAADDPVVLLEHVHRALGPTRGNISGWICTSEGRHGMTSVPGIAGHNARNVRRFTYELPPHAVVVLHSDGLADRWNLAASYPGLLTHSSHVIAGTLLRDLAVHRDDACVLVTRTEP